MFKIELDTLIFRATLHPLTPWLDSQSSANLNIEKGVSGMPNHQRFRKVPKIPRVALSHNCREDGTLAEKIVLPFMIVRHSRYLSAT